jgi:hypothetical protein
VEVAGPFKIEGKAYTIAAKSKPVETASPVVASDEPVVTRHWPPVIIVGILGILVVAAGIAIYKKKATI